MIDINPGILFVQILTFLIAMAILWKIAWGPLNNMISQRQDKIKKDLDYAEQAKQAVENLQKEYTAKLEEIQAKASEIIAEAKNESQKVKEEILRSAHQEAEELRKKAQLQLADERSKVIKALRFEITGLSFDIAEKILQQSVDKKMHDNLLKEMLEQLDVRPGNTKQKLQ
ncbi:MAG: ATP synthase F0 subunit B [Elusimicrobia bacterium RIFOXYA2_FULL_39_19]|nr:MAG: ATP synthase F0 subunit B [Elusimicrobia bacterium RIFOXYA2_FULL_39_19]